MLSRLLVSTVLAVLLIGCEKELTMPEGNRDKAVADRTVSLLRELRGVVNVGFQEGGTKRGIKVFGPETTQVDSTEYGIHWFGIEIYDDNGTPDPSDDTWQFIGTVEYLDWDFSEDWDLLIHIPIDNRETYLSIENNSSHESVSLHLASVNRPGGLQTGDGVFRSPNGDTLAFTQGVHHANTPDNYDDNYSWLEFFIYDEVNHNHPYWVHADFWADNSYEMGSDLQS